MRTLSWAVVGQPAAWIVGMPLVGLVGAGSWRLGWIALPLAASLVAALAVLGRLEQNPRPGRPGTRCRFASRSRATVFGAGSSPSCLRTRPGSERSCTRARCSSTSITPRAGRRASCSRAQRSGTSRARWASDAPPCSILTSLSRVLALGLAVCEAAFWWIRPDELTSTVLLTLTASVAGGRTLLSNSHALGHAPEVRTTLTGLRVATVQLGYFLGVDRGRGRARRRRLRRRGLRVRSGSRARGCAHPASQPVERRACQAAAAREGDGRPGALSHRRGSLMAVRRPGAHLPQLRSARRAHREELHALRRGTARRPSWDELEPRSCDQVAHR